MDNSTDEIEGSLNDLSEQFTREKIFGYYGKKGTIEMKQLKFTCPKCGKHELGSVEQVIMTYPITEITDEDVVYDSDNPTAGDGQVLAYQCMHCGFELEDEQGNSIDDCLQVIEWIKNNTSERTDG